MCNASTYHLSSSLVSTNDYHTVRFVLLPHCHVPDYQVEQHLKSGRKASPKFTCGLLCHSLVTRMSSSVSAESGRRLVSFLYRTPLRRRRRGLEAFSSVRFGIWPLTSEFVSIGINSIKDDNVTLAATSGYSRTCAFPSFLKLTGRHHQTSSSVLRLLIVMILVIEIETHSCKKQIEFLLCYIRNHFIG